MSGRLGVGASRVVRNEAESDIILGADAGLRHEADAHRDQPRYRRRVSPRFLARVLDLGFLGVLVAWSQVDVWAPQITTPNHMVGDSRVLSAASFAAGLALLARRRWPLATLVSVFGLLS